MGAILPTLRVLLLLAAMCCASSATAQQSPARPASTGDAAARLQLMERYIALTHRQALMAATYQKELGAVLDFCRNKPCQQDLDRDIKEVSADAARTYTQKITATYAERFTEKQLQALLRFTASPEGAAIARAQEEMSEDLSRLAVEMARNSQREISARFCPSHPTVCVRRSDRLAPSRTPPASGTAGGSGSVVAPLRSARLP
jgi:hypothetical protein